MAFFTKNTIDAKKESTSQTYGQMVLIGKSSVGANIVQNSQIKPGITPSITTVNILQTATSGQNNIDKTKSQIALAASSNNTDNVSIVMKNSESDSILNVGSVTNTESITATVIGSTLKTKDEIKAILTEAQKADLSVCLKSKDSEKIEFNTMKIPELQLNFKYQFFVNDESNIAAQEDPLRDPLLGKGIKEVPKFVELRWDIVEVSEELTDEELGSSETPQAIDIKEKAFKEPRGVSGYFAKNFNNSFNKSAKKLNLININENVKAEITDIHKLDKAFDSVSNEKTFSNSINVSVNTKKNSDLFDVLKGILK